MANKARTEGDAAAIRAADKDMLTLLRIAWSTSKAATEQSRQSVKCTTLHEMNDRRMEKGCFRVHGSADGLLRHSDAVCVRGGRAVLVPLSGVQAEIHPCRDGSLASRRP